MAQKKLNCSIHLVSVIALVDSGIPLMEARQCAFQHNRSPFKLKSRGQSLKYLGGVSLRGQRLVGTADEYTSKHHSRNLGVVEFQSFTRL